MKRTHPAIKTLIFGLGLVVTLTVIATLNRKDAESLPEVAQEVTVKDSFGDETKLAEIRNRETIKQQQELIVKETYLIEEKTRLQAEIAEVEKKLESIRGEKLSLQ